MISLNMCFGCSKEPSPREGSFEYPQQMFWNKKNNFQLRSLIWGPGVRKRSQFHALKYCGACFYYDFLLVQSCNFIFNFDS